MRTQWTMILLAAACAPLHAQETFRVGDWVLTDQHLAGRILAVKPQAYVVEYRTLYGGLAQPQVETAEIPAAVLREFNTPTRPGAGALDGLEGIVHDPHDAVFNAYVAKVGEIVKSMAPKFRGDPAKVAAAQKELVDTILQVQAGEHAGFDSKDLGRLRATRSMNQKLRNEISRPQRTFGQLLKPPPELQRSVGDTVDGTSLLWATLYRSGAVDVAGLHVQLVKSMTPNNVRQYSLLIRYPDGSMDMVDPIWGPRAPFQDAAWPQQTDALGSGLTTSVGSRRIVSVVGERVAAAFHRATPALKREAAGLAQYAAAYLLKEGFKAVETGDPRKIRDAATQLTEPAFWGSVALFSGAARIAEAGLARLPAAGALSRAAVPLAVGMAAVQIASGRFSPRDIAISTGAFLAAGFAVGAVADGLIYPVLFAAGPPGWIAAGAYSVVKLAVTLYVGEKLEAWVRELLERRSAREGIAQKLDGLAP